ncbi:hypothetical protein CYD30_28385, partial [Kosakonia cowanii]
IANLPLVARHVSPSEIDIIYYLTTPFGMGSKPFISYEIYKETNSNFVYNDEGDLVEKETSEEYWLINKIYVPSSLRGQGIARKMLSESIKEMRAERHDLTIKLWCEPQDADTDGEKLGAFYESFGFEFAGVECVMELK